jgi:predicted dehydrogenase
MHGQPTGALREEMAAFVSAVQSGGSTPVSLTDARAAVAAVLAAERSAASGTPVEVCG